ncbi:MAG: hypothetical protein JXA90_02300 [Planctomycetes bacterium]|nr:hypothetical protein [Planctomycetota bacterium]
MKLVAVLAASVLAGCVDRAELKEVQKDMFDRYSMVSSSAATARNEVKRLEELIDFNRQLAGRLSDENMKLFERVSRLETQLADENKKLSERVGMVETQCETVIAIIRKNQ